MCVFFIILFIRILRLRENRELYKDIRVVSGSLDFYVEFFYVNIYVFFFK